MQYKQERNIDMENNKDFNEEHNSVNEESEYQSQFSEIQAEMENEFSENAIENNAHTQVKEKKGIFKYIHPSIFIAICVFLAAALAFGVYKVFIAKTIEGTWIFEAPSTSANSTADEAEKTEMYYDFGNTDGDGKGELTIYSQGAMQKGDYTLSSDKDGLKISMGEEEYYYDVEGIRLFGNATLKLTRPESTDESTGTKVDEMTVELKQGSTPDYESDTYENYKTDNKLMGKWSFSQSINYYGQDISYSNVLNFKDNGILNIVVEQNDQSMEYFYAYTVKDKKLKLRQCSTDQEVEATYTIKGDKLTFDDKSIFAGITFYKDGKQSPSNIWYSFL